MITRVMLAVALLSAGTGFAVAQTNPQGPATTRPPAATNSGAGATTATSPNTGTSTDPSTMQTSPSGLNTSTNPSATGDRFQNPAGAPQDSGSTK
jgi:hypothetical protein